MRLASAVAVSFALHAATLVLTGSVIGHAGRAPQRTTAPMLVSISYAGAVPEHPFEPGVVRAEHDAPASPSADVMPSSVTSGPGFVLPEYFPTTVLTRLPEALTDFDTLFPQDAEPPPGRIELRLWLSRDGIIDKLEVLQADAPVALTSVALNAFRQMRFRPGEIRGIPVGSTADIVVEFARPAVANR